MANQLCYLLIVCNEAAVLWEYMMKNWTYVCIRITNRTETINRTSAVYRSARGETVPKRVIILLEMEYPACL